MIFEIMFLRKKFMFEVKMPSEKLINVSTLSETEFNEELEKGYADMQNGRTINAKSAFADIRKDYAI
jgi:DNA-damage-inducible protein J